MSCIKKKISNMGTDLLQSDVFNRYYKNDASQIWCVGGNKPTMQLYWHLWTVQFSLGVITVGLLHIVNHTNKKINSTYTLAVHIEYRCITGTHVNGSNSIHWKIT